MILSPIIDYGINDMNTSSSLVRWGVHTVTYYGWVVGDSTKVGKL